MGRLEGKVAIVTGAASGIGRASALAFAREGAKVLVIDRDAAALESTAQAVAALGGTALAHPADVGEETEVRRFVARAQDAFGGLDIVYANAGISGGLTPLLDQTPELWAEVLRVNLIGPFLAIKHAAPVMAARGGGSIVLTASVAGLRASAGGSAYASSKAGVISLAQTAAHALTGTGVRVNAICPGLIETGMTKPMFDHARAKGTDAKIGQLNPLKRAGRPEEIAAMALFLASDESSYVNGQAFAVDGGLSSSHPFTQAWR
jgi:NAD(P)-dependent dehydrogenase (short-subunit alcohol dehydrogenase family)